MLDIHELDAGADVFSSDGHKLGQLHRMVLKRSDLSLTHIVVDIGFLRSGRSIWQGGLGLDYDRVVPIDAIESASQERVVLNLSAEDFKDVPEYTEDVYEYPADFTPGEFDIPDVINRAQTVAAALSSTGNIWLLERLNKPLDGVDIKEGSPVWRREPHQKLGEIDRVILDQENRLSALVVRSGVLLKHDVILPVRYLAELLDDIVRVDISDAELAQLRQHSG